MVHSREPEEAYDGRSRISIVISWHSLCDAAAGTRRHSFMATLAVSTDEYLRRNPRWSQAMAGPEREAWLKADRDEAQQHLDKGTFQLQPHMGQSIRRALVFFR